MLWNSTSRALLFRQRPGKSGHGLLRILGLVLLAAALMKVHELSAVPYLDQFPPRWALIVFTEFEILFGLWLILKPPKQYHRITWLVATCLFLLFACVTLFKALAGEASCGCFGRVEISPWYTLIFDSSIVALLLWFRPVENRIFAWRNILLSLHSLRSKDSAASILGVGFIWLVFCIPSAWIMVNFVETDTRSDLSVLGHIFEGLDNKPVVVLEPEKWIGKEFPLLGHIDIEERLNEGEWIVLLFHHDCPDCQKIISKYTKLKDVFSDKEGLVHLALIESPPFSDLAEVDYRKSFHYAKGRLDESLEWFVESPVEIQLSRGIVTNVANRDEVVSKRKTAFSMQYSVSRTGYHKGGVN